jgi:hypothetical protein
MTLRDEAKEPQMFKLPAYDPTAIAMLAFGILAVLSLPFVFSHLQWTTAASISVTAFNKTIAYRRTAPANRIVLLHFAVEDVLAQVEHDTGLEGRRAFEGFLLSILQRIADSTRTSRQVR